MKPLSINDQLHLTMPIYADDESDKIVAYVHSAPISREVFEAHFSLVAQTFAKIYSGGYGMTAGPRIASLILHEVAKESGDALGAVSLMNEIRRLTNVICRTNAGWEHFSFQDVADRKMFDTDDLAEVTNAIVFFTVGSSMHRKRDKRTMLSGALKMWGASISSSDFMGFHALHATSTGAAPTTKSPEPVSSAVY